MMARFNIFCFSNQTLQSYNERYIFKQILNILQQTFFYTTDLQ